MANLHKSVHPERDILEQLFLIYLNNLEVFTSKTPFIKFLEKKFQLDMK